MSGSALMVALYYAAIPLLVVGISWIIIRRDYGGKQSTHEGDTDVQAGGR